MSETETLSWISVLRLYFLLFPMISQGLLILLSIPILIAESVLLLTDTSWQKPDCLSEISDMTYS